MTAPALARAGRDYEGRVYVQPNRPWEAPSITNVKDKRNIPGLKRWGPKVCAQYVADNIEKLTHLSPSEIFQLVKEAPFARDSVKAESADVGDVVHNWIDNYIKGQPPSQYDLEHPTKTVASGQSWELQRSGANTARNMYRQFLAVVEKYRPQWIDSEFTVWSDTYRYAGTADWSAYITTADGVRHTVLGDTKTGKQPYADTRYQLTALAHADYIIEADGTTRPLPKFDMYAVLHVRPRGAKLIPYDTEAVDNSFRAFLGLREVLECDTKYDDRTLLYAPTIQAR